MKSTVLLLLMFNIYTTINRCKKYILYQKNPNLSVDLWSNVTDVGQEEDEWNEEYRERRESDKLLNGNEAN